LQPWPPDRLRNRRSASPTCPIFQQRLDLSKPLPCRRHDQSARRVDRPGFPPRYRRVDKIEPSRQAPADVPPHFGLMVRHVATIKAGRIFHRAPATRPLAPKQTCSTSGASATMESTTRHAPRLPRARHGSSHSPWQKAPVIRPARPQMQLVAGFSDAMHRAAIRAKAYESDFHYVVSSEFFHVVALSAAIALESAAPRLRQFEAATGGKRVARSDIFLPGLADDSDPLFLAVLGMLPAKPSM